MTGPAILVVTGASGAGKTTAVTALEARSYADVRCHYYDSFVRTWPREDGDPWSDEAKARWFHSFASDDAVHVLDIQSAPSRVRAAFRSAPDARVQIVLLDCGSDEVRHERLIARGQPELAMLKMDMWSAYLRGQADALGLPVIETAHVEVEDVASALEQHLELLRRGLHDVRELT